MSKIIVKLKTHWGVTSIKSVILILTTFALTGFSILYTHRWINKILGIEKEDPFWMKMLTLIIVIMPLYYLYLYIWGILLGQRKFVTMFIKTKLKLISAGKLFKNL